MASRHSQGYSIYATTSFYEIHTTFTPSIEPQFQKNNFEINQNLFKTWLRLFQFALHDPVGMCIVVEIQF